MDSKGSERPPSGMCTHGNFLKRCSACSGEREAALERESALSQEGKRLWNESIALDDLISNIFTDEHFTFQTFLEMYQTDHLSLETKKYIQQCIENFQAIHQRVALAMQQLTERLSRMRNPENLSDDLRLGRMIFAQIGLAPHGPVRFEKKGPLTILYIKDNKDVTILAEGSQYSEKRHQGLYIPKFTLRTINSSEIPVIVVNESLESSPQEIESLFSHEIAHFLYEEVLKKQEFQEPFPETEDLKDETLAHIADGTSADIIEKTLRKNYAEYLNAVPEALQRQTNEVLREILEELHVYDAQPTSSRKRLMLILAKEPFTAIPQKIRALSTHLKQYV